MNSFKNYNCYIPSCLVSCVCFRNGSFHFSTLKVKVIGNGFHIYGTYNHIIIYGRFFLCIHCSLSKSGNVDSLYLATILNAISK